MGNHKRAMKVLSGLCGDGNPRFALRLLPILIRSACLMLPASAAMASPQDGTVIAGQGVISQPDGTTTVIQQQSNSLAIDWRSFNLSAGDRVRFEQPSSSAAVLNRVLDQQPSWISGSIQANGRVFLINSAGIIFGSGARVNVGSLVASSLDMSTSDFMAGKYRFQSAPGHDSGMLVNRGVIRAATGGSVSLIGGAVANQGVIVANYGYVNLGAGRQAVIDFGGDGLMGFQVSGAVLSNAMGVKSAVSNSGAIEAAGGEVVLTGQAAADVFTEVVNNQGVVRAGRIDDHGGVIRLAATGGGVVNTGTLDASAAAIGQHGGSVVMVGPQVTQGGVVRADAARGNGGTVTLQASGQAVLDGGSVTSAQSTSGGTGGTVQVLGSKVGLFDQASIDVSGARGGGTVLVGGNARGQGPLPNASYAYMASGASIDANANVTGHGGHVVLWSNDVTHAYGSIEARGGMQGGDGGLIETSGSYLDTSGLRVDAAATKGSAGNWLLDPYDVAIVPAGTAGASTTPTTTGSTDTWTSSSNLSTVDAGAITTDLQNGTNVTVATGNGSTGNGNISVQALIDPVMSTAATLTLNAAGNIDIAPPTGTTSNVGVSASGTSTDLSVNLTAGGAITEDSKYGEIQAGTLATSSATGTTLNNLNNAISTFNGTNTVSGDIALTNVGTLNLTGITQSVGGTVTVNNTGALQLSGAVDTGSGTATLTASGTIDQTAGTITAGTLTTSSAGGMTMNGANAVNTFNATNTTSGNITLTNGHVLDVTGVSQAGGGAVAVANTGSVTVSGAVNAGTGTVSLDAGTGAIAGSGVITAGTVNLQTLGGTGAVGTSGSALKLASSTGTGTTTVNVGTGTNSVGGLYLSQGIGSGNLDVNTLYLTANNPLSLATAGILTLPAQAIDTGSGALTLTSGAGALSMAGALSTTGSLTLAANGGNLTLGDALNAGTATLTASGTIDQTAGTITAGTLTTSSAGGMTMNGANAVNTFNATNTTSGNITLTNGHVLDVTGVSQAGGGAVAVANTGSVTVSGAVNAGTGTVSLDAGTGAIAGSGVITAGTVNLQTLGGTGAVGTSGSALKLASSTGTGTTTVNVGAGGTPVAGIYLQQASGNVTVGSIYGGSSAVSVSSSGNINGDGAVADRINSTGAVTLTSGGGIGTAVAVNTALGGSGTLTLTSQGSGTAGNIVLSDSGAMRTSQITSATFSGTGTHFLSLGATSWTVDQNIGNTANDLFLGSSNGGIGGGGGVLIARNLDLAAVGGDIGSATTPLPTVVGGILTTQTSGSGIYLTNSGTLNVGTVTTAGGALSINSGPSAINITGTVNTGAGPAMFDGSSVDETGTGAVQAGNLTVTSLLGVGMQGANDVGALNIVNGGTGNAVNFNNSGSLTISGITQNGGTLSVNNSGALAIDGALTSNGALTVTASGSISQPGTLVSNGGNISVTSSTGSIDLSPAGSANSGGGNIYYTAGSGDVKLGLLDAGAGTVKINANNGSILSINGNPAAPNVIAANALLTAGQFIGSETQSIAFDVPSSGMIDMTLGAPVAYISNPNGALIVSNSVVSDITSQVASLGARGQAAGMQTVGYVDWSAFSPNLRLFGVREPALKLPAGQQDQ